MSTARMHAGESAPRRASASLSHKHASATVETGQLLHNLAHSAAQSIRLYSQGGSDHRSDPLAVVAGHPGGDQEPALHKLEHDALNVVLAQLEPESLALTGPLAHSTRLYVCF